VGLAIFGLLLIAYTLHRQVYFPDMYDIPALADGMLLAPGALWQDWFTRGYSHFWDVYPEWPRGVRGCIPLSGAIGCAYNHSNKEK
jgi:hypothetical protein